MDIHEYQAKVLLAEFGMPIAKGGIAYSPEQAAYRAMELGGEKWVVKAQVHSGARGKAGGIKVCETENEVPFGNFRRSSTFSPDTLGLSSAARIDG